MVIAFLCDKIFSHVTPIVNIVSMLHIKCEKNHSHKYYTHILDCIPRDTIFYSKIFSVEYNCTFVVALLHMRFIFRQSNKRLFYYYLEHRLCCAKYR